MGKGTRCARGRRPLIQHHDDRLTGPIRFDAWRYGFTPFGKVAWHLSPAGTSSFGLGTSRNTANVPLAASISESTSVTVPSTLRLVGNSGAIYLFGRAGDETWKQLAYLKPPKPSSGARFGTALALSANGGTLAVGAPRNDLGVAASTGPGVVYMFTRTEAGQWALSGELHAAGVPADDVFGGSIAINATGSIVGVAARQAPEAAPDTGAVHLFRRERGTDWRPVTQIQAPEREALRFGSVLGLDANGETLIVGVPQDAVTAPGAGGAYFFRAGTDGRWEAPVRISPPNENVAGRFGAASIVSADGKTVIVSAPLEYGTGADAEGRPDSGRVEGAGAVYVFQRDSG